MYRGFSVLFTRSAKLGFFRAQRDLERVENLLTSPWAADVNGVDELQPANARSMTAANARRQLLGKCSSANARRQLLGKDADERVENPVVVRELQRTEEGRCIASRHQVFIAMTTPPGPMHHSRFQSLPSRRTQSKSSPISPKRWPCQRSSATKAVAL